MTSILANPTSGVRQLVFERLALVLSRLRPGLLLQPDALEAAGRHRPIEVDLRDAGRLLTDLEDPETFPRDESAFPYVCIVQEEGESDVIVPLDEACFEVVTPATIVGYSVRRSRVDRADLWDPDKELDALRRDLQCGVESFPRYTEPGLDALVERVGDLSVVLRRVDVATPHQNPYGSVTLRYHFRYVADVADL